MPETVLARAIHDTYARVLGDYVVRLMPATESRDKLVAALPGLPTSELRDHIEACVRLERFGLLAPAPAPAPEAPPPPPARERDLRTYLELLSASLGSASMTLNFALRLRVCDRALYVDVYRGRGSLPTPPRPLMLTFEGGEWRDLRYLIDALLRQAISQETP